MFSPFVKLLCAAVMLGNVVVAQDIFITLPTENTTVTAGSNVTVQLEKPLPLGLFTGSTDVAVVIGAEPCTSVCPNVAEGLGDILYLGRYNPKPETDSPYPYQNFTVVIPASYSGPTQLGVAHIYLLGAGGSVQLQLMNATLNVVAPN